MVGIWIFSGESLSWLNSNISIILDGFTLKYYGYSKYSQFNAKDEKYYYLALT